MDIARTTLACALCAVLALPVCAQATLGETPESTELDRASMGASLRLSPAGQFTIHDMSAPSGTSIREYVSPTGKVFAVTWQGPVIPDLRQLLGRYFERYTAAGKQAGRRQIEVRDADFVLQSQGHMRAFSGRAYLPQLLPQGVAAEQIQ